MIQQSHNANHLNQQYLTMSLGEEINQLSNIKAESLLYQVQHADFNNFQELGKYLESAETVISQKVQQIEDKIEIVYEQFIRRSSVFEINNKKRQKEEELLKIERERIQKQLISYSERLQEFKINPITLQLKTEHYELEKLEQTKTIIEQFQKLIKGDQNQLKKIMPLDEKNFGKSAIKIYIFKTLLDDMAGDDYAVAKLQVNKKYDELKYKIIQHFKQGYWNQDYKLIRNILPYCEEYQLLEETSQFYNEQIFKSVHKITKLNIQNNQNGLDESMQQEELAVRKLEEQQAENQIKNLFFEIEQGFKSIFSYKDELTGQINPEYIETVFSKFSGTFSRKLITHAFDKIIKQSLQNILKATISSSAQSSKRIATSSTYYLCYLQIFYDECKKLLKNLEAIVSDDKSVHLIFTHFQSIFDSYLDSYIHKQMNNLQETYEKCTAQLVRDISNTAITGTTSYTKQRERVAQIGAQKNIGTAYKIKNLFSNFMIDSKKDIFVQNQTAQTPSITPNQEVKRKIENLEKIFRSSSLQNIFATTKRALVRNDKIAKINQIDRNRNEIQQIFISNMEEIIQNLISLISEIIPKCEDSGIILDPEFFLVIPNINLLLQRIEIIFEQFKKDNKYRLAETIRIEQKKQELINKCGKSLSNVVGDGLAVILTSENTILHMNIHQYYVVNSDNMGQPSAEICTKLINLLERYIKQIQKISLNSYKKILLKNLGLQFVNLLIDFYSSIPYTKAGLSKIFMDIAKYKTIISAFRHEQIENQFKLLRILIDIYVIKNDEKVIEEYLKNEGLQGRTNNQKGYHLYKNSDFNLGGNSKGNLQKIVKGYIENKQKFEKNV